MNIKIVNSIFALLMLLGLTSALTGAEWRYVDFPYSWSESKGWILSYPVEGGIWENSSGGWEFLEDTSRIVAPDSLLGRTVYVSVPEVEAKAFIHFFGAETARFFNSMGMSNSGSYVYTVTGSKTADLYTADLLTREWYSFVWTAANKGNFSVKIKYINTGQIENFSGNFQFLD